MKPILFALFLISCNVKPGSLLVPDSGPGTEYPCGLHAHSCGGGMCCSENFDCGGITPGCPAGACCFAGGDSTKWGMAPLPRQFQAPDSK